MSMMKQIKEKYWTALRKWDQFRRPPVKLLTPHDPFDAIRKHVGEDRAAGRQLVYVDGGAHDGVMARRFAEQLGNIEVHAFEPNPDLFGKLQANLSSLPGKQYNAALGAEPGTLALNINASPMTSSVLPIAELSERYFPLNTQPKETVEVEAMTLDQWFADAQPARVDILKLDLQGYELEALKGAKQMLAAGVGCLYLEVNFAEFYAGNALFSDVEQFLREQGYQLYNLYHLCTHEPDGQIGSADAIFIPKAKAQRTELHLAA